MVALLHFIIVEIENERIKKNIRFWQWQKNFCKYKNSINNDIKLFYYFKSVKLFKKQLKKLEYDRVIWGRGF